MNSLNHDYAAEGAARVAEPPRAEERLWHEPAISVPQARRELRQVALPWLQHLASGGQAHVFSQPGASWVVKVPRFSILSLLALYMRFPGQLDQVQSRLGGLALPFTRLGPVEFSSVEVRGAWDYGLAQPGTVRQYRRNRALLTTRISAEHILEEQLERGSPSEVAAGLEALLSLLERLRERGFYMVDFVMKNFAWHQGALVIVDMDLIIPTRLTTHPHYAPCVYFFRRGLLVDYARIIHNALDRTPIRDAATRSWLLRLEQEFPARVLDLAKPEGNGAKSAAPEPVTFPAELADEVARLLAPRES